MHRKEQRYTIGRSRTCDIVLADRSVSSIHADLILMPNGKMFVVDRDSTNGTAVMVDGAKQKIRQEFVSPTDTVLFGNVTMKVKDLLEAVRLRFPIADTAGSEDPEHGKSEWVRAPRLERCVCGIVKPAGGTCPTCGR